MAYSALPSGASLTASSAEHPPSIVDRAAAILARVTARRSTGGADQLRNESLPPVPFGLPWRRTAAPVPAGGSTTVQLRIENLESVPVSVSLYAGELLSDGRGSIPSSAISFDPATVSIGAGQRAVVTAGVAVPPASAPGAYSGLVQAAGLPGAKAVITVEVS
jgi:hypothetical protein